MKTSTGKRAVVLLSGGLDSTTCLAVATREGYSCHTLAIDYGQRHRSELEASARVAEAFGAAAHRVVRIDLRAIGGSALTDDIDDGEGNVAADPRLERFSVQAVNRQGALFIELTDQLDPERDGRVVARTFTFNGSEELPEWMKLLKEGFISATPPADIGEITLGVSLILETGKDLSKLVVIDVQSGAVIELAEEAVIVDDKPVLSERAKPADKSKQEPVARPIELGMKDFRGSLDLADRQG